MATRINHFIDEIYIIKYNNIVFDKILKFIKNEGVLNQEKTPACIPYIAEKNYYKKIKKENLSGIENHPNIAEDSEYEVLHSKDIIVFQDEDGNYIQCEPFGRESIILQSMVGLNSWNSKIEISKIFQSVKDVLLLALGELPAIYLNMKPTIQFGYMDERNFNNMMDYITQEFGFKIYSIDEHHETAWLCLYPQTYSNQKIKKESSSINEEKMPY